MSNSWFTEARYGLFIHYGLYSLLERSAIVNALTLLGAWLKLPADCAQIAPWHARLLAAIDAHEWDAAPEMRRVVRAILRDDHVENVASYLQFHQPEGEGYERARSGEAMRMR